MLRLTHLLQPITLALLACTVGCGPSDGLKSTNEQDAYARVMGLTDLASSDEQFAEAFVAGSTPENRRDYAKHGYDLAGVATFEGDTAVVPVKVFGGVYDSAAGDRAARRPSASSETTQQWTLQLVDGDWKIKDAPLG